jgi:hypothetical protein
MDGTFSGSLGWEQGSGYFPIAVQRRVEIFVLLAIHAKRRAIVAPILVAPAPCGRPSVTQSRRVSVRCVRLILLLHPRVGLLDRIARLI